MNLAPGALHSRRRAASSGGRCPEARYQLPYPLCPAVESTGPARVQFRLSLDVNQNLPLESKLPAPSAGEGSFRFLLFIRRLKIGKTLQKDLSCSESSTPSAVRATKGLPLRLRRMSVRARGFLAFLSLGSTRRRELQLATVALNVPKTGGKQ